MSRYLVVLVLFFFTQQSYSQVLWFRDFESAQAYALEENKLIVIDFWATWCGPCKDMDFRLWNTDEFKAISDHIIPLKIDIDHDREMAAKYNISAIPKVVITNVYGEVIHEETGFSNPNSYLSIFQSLPNDVKMLNNSLKPLLENNESEGNYFEIGLAYQELGRINDHAILKNDLIGISNLYFKRVKGKEGNANLQKMSELHQILNQAYKGKTKQVNKKLAKLDGSYTDPELVELFNFIQAYCYKIDGDEKNFLIKKNDIENKDYLNLLDG